MRNSVMVLARCFIVTLPVVGCSETSEPMPPEAAQLNAQVPVQADDEPALQGESEAVSVLKAYLAEPKWQERVKYVRSGERVRPIMQQWYAKNYKPFQNENIRVFPAKPKTVPVGSWISLTAEWDAYGRKQAHESVLFRTRDGFKVDWEASVGYNQRRLPVFVAKRGDEAVAFRVSCKLSNYHNFEYANTKSSHYSVSAQADGMRIHGYIARKSATGERIYELLKDGLSHRLILQFQHIGPRGESMKDSNSQGEIVAMTKLVSESWVLPQ